MSERTTRQGVRDLNPRSFNARRRREACAASPCVHVWEDAEGWDCMHDYRYTYQRCGFCHGTRTP